MLRVLIHRPARRARFRVLGSASPPRSRIWGWTTSGSSIRASRSFEWRRGSRAGRCATSRRWPIKSSRLPAAERALHLGEPADWQDARQSVSTCPPRSPGRRAGRQRKEDCDNRLRRVARYSQGQPAVVTGCWVGLRGLGNGRQTSAARRVPLYCSIENRRLNCATDTMRVCSRRLASSKSWSPVTRKSAWAASAHAMNLASLLSRGNRKSGTESTWVIFWANARPHRSLTCSGIANFDRLSTSRYSATISALATHVNSGRCTTCKITASGSRSRNAAETTTLVSKTTITVPIGRRQSRQRSLLH